MIFCGRTPSLGALRGSQVGFYVIDFLWQDSSLGNFEREPGRLLCN